MASDEERNLYDYYVPNKVLAIVFAAIFLILTGLHMWRIISTRQWFGLAIVIGGLFEIVGLAARAFSHDHLSTLSPYILQYVLILLAPILYTASVYMFLGRMIRVSGHPKLSLIRINWITKIFVVGDVLCFLIQAFGGISLANLANSHDKDIAHKVDLAKNVILAGLALQVIFFLIFALCAVVFHVRVSKPGIAESVDPTLHLNIMMTSIYVTSILITGRNIYRLVEYKSGNGGYLQEHEWPTYGLDVGLMAIFMIITFFWYFADTKARTRTTGKYNRVHDAGVWSGNVNEDSYPLTQSNPYESGYGNPQNTTHTNSYGNEYNNAYGHAYGNV